MTLRLLVVLVMAPVVLCVVGTAVVDSRYHAGLAPVAFLLPAYVVGVALWGTVCVIAGETLTFRAVLVVLGIVVLCVITDTNARLALWAIAAPAIGGLAVSTPLPFDDRELASG